MRIAIILSYILLAALDIYILRRAHSKKISRMMKPFYLMVASVCVMMAVETLILGTSVRSLAFAGVNLYYIAFAWMFAGLVRFAQVFAGQQTRPFPKSATFWVTILSNIVIIYNHFDHIVFSITHTEWFGHSYWVVYQYYPFYIYLLVFYVMLMYAVAIQVRDGLRSARIYLVKYIGTITVIIIATACYSVCVFSGTPVYIASAIIAFACAAVIYTSAFAAPSRLVHSALVFVADRLNDGVVLFDDNHHLQFCTDSFLESFDCAEQGCPYDEAEFIRTFMDSEGDSTALAGYQRAVVKDGDVRYYEIKNKTLMDKEHEVGTVYWLVDTTETVMSYAEMEFKANYDELTGVYNERHFTEQAEKLLAERPDTDYAMLCTDIDEFKLFEERFGHEKSIELLVTMANAISDFFAGNDNVVYGRINADNFAILVPTAGLEEYEFEMIMAMDNVTMEFCTAFYILHMIMGGYRIFDRSVDIRTMVNRAIMAAASARGKYNQQFVWYDEKSQEIVFREAKYSAELNDAIESGQIRMFLQPQVDASGKVVGAEALVRWIHPEDGIIPPGKFIPCFEQNGKITEIDMHIWRLACSTLRDWKRMGRDDLHISVNISAKDIYAVNVYEKFTELVERYDISPANLKLEITESAFAEDMQQHIALVEKLQNAGFAVEMDDFGSAYSSFNMLKDICVDVLKIDMKFLADTENVIRSRTILESIVNLAKELKMSTVAEGVETVSQYEFLKAAGCEVYQGYYFAKPMPVSEFEEKHIGVKN